MKPGTYLVCDACGRKRGIAAAECPYYNCPWLIRHAYREHAAKLLGTQADKFYAGVDPARGLYDE